MDLHWLKPLLGRPSPFTTVYLDATRTGTSNDAEVVDRWKPVRRSLERDGASASVLDQIAELVTVPTGVRGPHGRVVVADAEGVVIDRVLAEPPAQSHAVFGPAPALLPAVRAADETVTYLLVEVDRTGADLTWAAGGTVRTAGGAETETVEGGHDAVRKTRAPGIERRNQTRAEDSWERNAEAVAAVLDKRVAERSPDLVIVTGDVREVKLVCEALGQQARELTVEVQGGSRGEGVNQGAFDARVGEALEQFRARRREVVLDRFREAQGRGDGAVTALDDVIEVLRRGQVLELVLHVDGQTAGIVDRTLWVGPEPLQLATSRGDLESIGVSEAREMEANVALVRAALGQDAGVTFAENGTVDLVDGIGAVLRWSDDSTPSEAVPTQSADQARLRTVV
ncbi:baeRF2 domain-containing protein [Cellulomonas xylanilytica]|uniref:Peptide chain release factor 1 n=1 Tax=Cellulomonas xylanilytica TaxID=233583 RepID=A0A510V1Y7_9CELL|nr:hypothetical protein [Cellulomonas xylanilytica]GEK20806.1 hypothetical protein CXY01_13260 [Cellulomonas xylanilytica]